MKYGNEELALAHTLSMRVNISSPLLHSLILLFVESWALENLTYWALAIADTKQIFVYLKLQGLASVWVSSVSL